LWTSPFIKAGRALAAEQDYPLLDATIRIPEIAKLHFKITQARKKKVFPNSNFRCQSVPQRIFFSIINQIYPNDVHLDGFDCFIS
jgi:hypothetical protein